MMVAILKEPDDIVMKYFEQVMRTKDHVAKEEKYKYVS